MFCFLFMQLAKYNLEKKVQEQVTVFVVHYFLAMKIVPATVNKVGSL